MSGDVGAELVDDGPPRGSAADLPGRDRELARIRAFVDDPRTDPSLLLLVGEAGIGKSALWQRAVSHAQDVGARVLTTRPAPADHGLPHAGLGDLLGDVADLVLPRLLPPRRRALERALVLVDDDGGGVDPRVLGTATRDALTLLSATSGLLLAVDDLAWLDPASAMALAFAMRRLSEMPVRLVATARSHDPGVSPLLDDGIDAGSTVVLDVGPLDAPALHRCVRQRLGHVLDRDAVARLRSWSAGNPLHALELVRSTRGRLDPGHLGDLPPSLGALVQSRLAGLPDDDRHALGLVAAAGSTSTSQLVRVGVPHDVLRRAFEAGLLVRDGDVVRFAHPLVATTLYRLLDVDREAVHARLAAVVEDPIARARHVALATTGPDADVAHELTEAARVAAERGAAALGAELAEHAARLTPVGTAAATGSDRDRRVLLAARAHLAAGGWARAAELARDVVTRADLPATRVDGLVLLAEMAPPDRAVPLLRQALDHAADERTRAALLVRLAWATRFRDGYDGALRHAERAVHAAQRSDDHRLRSRAAIVHDVLGWMVGTTAAPEPGGLPELADALGGERLVQEAVLAIANSNTSPVARARTSSWFAREVAALEDRDEPLAACAHWGLAWLDLWAGSLTSAGEHARRSHELALQYGEEVPQDLLPLAVVALHAGHVDAAEAHAHRALDIATEQLGLHLPQHQAVLGVAAQLRGDADVAAALLARAEEQAGRLGLREPSLRWWTGDHVEVLLVLGRPDDAAAVLERWSQDVQRTGRDWWRPHVLRGRALVASAAGDHDEATALLTTAVREHGEHGDPVGRARSLTALGGVHRRARRWRAARTALQESAAELRRAGAVAWAELADREGERVSGHGRMMADVLSPAERRVADLVARGATNREAAAALFLSERTVGSHLTHVYAKLGIRSRTELAHVLHHDPVVRSPRLRGPDDSTGADAS